MTEPAITDQQANDALKQMLVERQTGQQLELAQSPPDEAPEAAPAEEPAEPAPAEPAEPEPEAAAAESPAAESDDLASLKQRLAERDKAVEEAEKRHQARLDAMQSRSQANERILRERHLRKSTAADRALKLFRAWKQTPEQGVPESDVDRVIAELEGTMNPQSPSYQPPATPVEASEDTAIALNAFLNEKQMDMGEADEFGKWIKADGAGEMNPNEQALAYRDIDGFLRLAHLRWQESKRAKINQRASAVEAVKTVQRTQKQAAKAASAAPAAPRKTTVASKSETIDYSKVTQDDVSNWLRQSVEQYK